MSSTAKMNGDWETVGRQTSKPQQNHSNKNKPTVSHKIMPEYDIPVTGSTFQLFMDKEIRKEERKLAKKDAAVKTQAKQSRQTAVIKNENNLKERKPNDVGKNLKPKQADKSNHVNSTAPKETPKGLENALKSLNKEKIDSIIENTTTRFPNSPIVWLLDLSSFLNSRIDRDPQDMAFSQKPPDYPTCLMKKDVRDSLTNLLKKCNQGVIQQFQAECLKEVETNISKNHPASGYTIMIQLIAAAFPQLCPVSLSKYKESEKNYGHNDRIITTILWSALQPGYYSLNSAIKTWVEIFKPLVSHKYFGKMAVESLSQIVESHFSRVNQYPMDPKDFIQLMEFAYSLEKNPAVSQKLARSVMTSYSKLRDLIYSKQDKTVKAFFPAFLAQLRPNISTVLRDQICCNLVKCLNTTNHCYSVWRQVYKNNLSQTTTLLDFLSENWDRKQARISNPKIFKETLRSFCVINNELASSNKAPKCLSKLDVLATKLLTKTPQPKTKKKSSSLWKIFTYSLAIGLLIFIDCQINGSFQKSKTYELLDKVQAIKYGEKFWNDYGYPYYTKASKIVGPYLELGWKQFSDKARTLWQRCGPVREWTERNLPPFINYLETKILPKILEVAQEAIVVGSKAFMVARDYSIEYGKKAVIWLETNVFTGSLSRQNIASYIHNATESAGHWINEVYLLALSKYKQLTV